MPFDMIGWAEAAPGTGTVGLTRAAGDSLYRRGTGDDIFILPKVGYIVGAVYLAETTAGYIRLKQPGGDLYWELLAGADINTDPNPGYHHFFDRPLPIIGGEVMTVESNNATDEDTVVGLMVSDGYIGPPAAPDYIIRGISDTTLTALTWTACTVTWSQNLPKGTYAIVSCRMGCYKASGYGGGVGRLTGLDDPAWRPGVPLELATGDKVTMVTAGQYPLWAAWPVMAGITCEHDDMPDIECLSPFANTDEVVELGLKKIG